MNKVKLKDITLSITDGKHGDCEAEEQSGYYFISCKDVYDGKIHYDGAREITKRDFSEANKRTMLAPNDILITNSGTIGRMALIKESPKTYRTTFQKSVAIVKPNIERVLPEYLYYQLQNCVSLFVNQSNGSAQKNLLLSTMREFDILVHESIDEQRKLADILSAYDNLIENNQKQIKLLEEAAQRLYKEWFVDLRFPGHETTPIVDGVPEGWRSCHLDDVISFNPKVSLDKERLKQSVPMSALSTTSMVLDTDEFTTTFSNGGSKFQNGDTLLARITPCLENGKTAYVSCVESEEGAVGSTEYIVMRAKGINPYMVYLLARTDSFRQSAINSMTGSDGRQRAQVDKLKMLLYLKPSERIIRLFAKYVEPMFLQVQKKNEQNIRLRQARDRLLPKLISGELEV